MGYLEDLRAQKAREEAAGVKKPTYLTDKEKTEWGEQRLRDTGIAEVAELLGKRISVDRVRGSDASTGGTFEASITTRFEQIGMMGSGYYDKDVVRIRARSDGGIELIGETGYLITPEAIKANPDLVTEALGEVISKPAKDVNYPKPVPNQSDYFDPTSPQPEPHDYSR